MKKLIATILLTAMTITMPTMAMDTAHVMETKFTGEPYAMTAIVTDVNYDHDTVTITDMSGEDWIFFGCEDWFKGDICACLMDDMGTEYILDDRIIGIPIYQGHLSFISQNDYGFMIDSNVYLY